MENKEQTNLELPQLQRILQELETESQNMNDSVKNIFEKVYCIKNFPFISPESRKVKDYSTDMVGRYEEVIDRVKHLNFDLKILSNHLNSVV